jgi:DNA-binding response OmpR family regulator
MMLSSAVHNESTANHHKNFKQDKARTKWEDCNLKHIMIIDDDIHIGNMLEETLTKEGYSVSRAYSGTEAVLVLSKTKPDLILLDLMLPGLSGEELLPQIKGIPVIVVSAKVDVDNKVDLLLGGAADYVTKPFDIKELLARIAVQFRKIADSAQISTLTFADIVLDTDTHVVTIADHEIRLTRTEFAILKLLMQTPSQVITKSHLLDSMGEDTPDCTESSLKTHISHLRGKLRDAGGKDYIEAVWGIGFKMKEI